MTIIYTSFGALIVKKSVVARSWVMVIAVNVNFNLNFFHKLLNPGFVVKFAGNCGHEENQLHFVTSTQYMYLS